jgi:7-carboxy-7-deazaguanine synthase
VLDLKTPGSGESHRNDWENLNILSRKDQIKFVICDEQDYVWAKAKMLEGNLIERAGEILFSPSCGQQDPKQLAQWILDDRLAVRMQLQLHKLLWESEPGR